MKRTYKSYAIKVIDKDGERIVKLNKNVKMDNFKVAVDSYHKSKNIYKEKNEDVIVELVGVVDGQGKIGNTIYSKQFKRRVAEENKELLKSTDEIVSEIKHLLNLLDEKKDYHENMRGVYDKRRSVILHKLESLKKFNGSKAELMDNKIKLLNSLEETCYKRRTNKNECKKISVVYKEVDMCNTLKQFNNLHIPIEIEEYEYIDDTLEKRIITEFPYSTEKERVGLMKQLEGKYAKIVIDKANSKIVAYNNGIFNTNRK